MNEIQRLIDRKGGTVAFAKWLGKPLRTVQDWRKGTNTPRESDVELILRLERLERKQEQLERFISFFEKIEMDVQMFLNKNM